MLQLCPSNDSIGRLCLPSSLRSRQTNSMSCRLSAKWLGRVNAPTKEKVSTFNRWFLLKDDRKAKDKQRRPSCLRRSHRPANRSFLLFCFPNDFWEMLVGWKDDDRATSAGQVEAATSRSFLLTLYQVQQQHTKRYETIILFRSRPFLETVVFFLWAKQCTSKKTIASRLLN